MPQWRQGLTKSLHQTRSVPESRYFQLASVDSMGVPYCRTVVFRGMTDDNQLVVISDTRSEKFEQLSQTPEAHVCWYFSPLNKMTNLSRLSGINYRMLAKSNFYGESRARPEMMGQHYKLKGVLTRCQITFAPYSLPLIVLIT